MDPRLCGDDGKEVGMTVSGDVRQWIPACAGMTGISGNDGVKKECGL